MDTHLADTIASAVASAEDPERLISEIRAVLSGLSGQRGNPVDHVRWVPVEKICPNDYNPNQVAPVEMNLLRVSIVQDGFTQPIVTVYDADADRYVIVDGFHRFFTGSKAPEIRERCHGMLPVVVIDKPANDRMASTIRHNRARGRHTVDGMASMVFKMLDNGWADVEICKELGMEAEELVRIKHITGFSRLFSDTEYRKAWVTREQIKAAKALGVPTL